MYKSVKRLINSRKDNGSGVILVKASEGIHHPSLHEVAAKFLTAEKLKKDFPKMKVICYLPEFRNDMLKNALRQTLSLAYNVDI